jgi:hypothetical protein
VANQFSATNASDLPAVRALKKSLCTTVAYIKHNTKLLTPTKHCLQAFLGITVQLTANGLNAKAHQHANKPSFVLYMTETSHA